jgi:hypothetical protein
MPRAAKPTPPPPAQLSRVEWALAFERKVDELRPDMGRKYLATVIATLWPKHHAEDPEQVAAQWTAERQSEP